MEAKLTQIPSKHRSGWLDALDGRLGLAKEMRQRFQMVANDLGGVDRLSYMERSLVERALWLEYWLAQQESALAEGADFDAAKWTQGLNSLQGVYSKLGLDRRASEVEDLQSFKRRKRANG